MTTSPICALAHKGLPLNRVAGALFAALFAALALLSGCSSFGGGSAKNKVQAKADAKAETKAEAAPPAQPAAARAPARAIGNFSGALRCMDTLLLDYGTRDVSVIVEELEDKTRGSAVTKEMLVAVVSDMTQRSRAIRLVASGKEWGNTVTHMSQALKRAPLTVVPQYALRGTISQIEGVSAGRADAASAGVLTIDLTMLTTQDLSVVPGVATRNSVVLFNKNAQGFGGGEIRKFGASFSLPTGSDEGRVAAVRALVELASIETFGRLAKVPYWTCLGLTDAHEGVGPEIKDWYDAMAARPAEIIRFFQTQLRMRRVYEGPLDGVVNPQLKEAVARYREALGLSREPKLSLDFFQAYLGADHAQVEARTPPALVALVDAPGAPSNSASGATSGAVRGPASGSASGPARGPARGAASAPLALQIAAANDARWFTRGEPVQLTVRPNRDAHVYCYLQDENRKIMRFFPNRFQRDSRVQPAEGLALPGAMRFELFMNLRGVQETVACFATERDVLPQLPPVVSAGDFDPLPVASLEQVRHAFVKASGGLVAQESFLLRSK